MTQKVSTPPPKNIIDVQALSRQQRNSARMGVFAMFAIVVLLILLFTGLSIGSLSPPLKPTSKVQASPTPTPSPNDSLPLLLPGNITPAQLQLTTNHYVLYEQNNKLFRVSTSGTKPELLTTPGYVYNRAVPPVLTSSGQLLYSGDGLWLADLVSGTSQQIATLPRGQVITSMALSSDSLMVAWSTEPTNGSGDVTVYAGPLEKSVVVYQQDATQCPCFRVFSFLDGSGALKDTTLLLTDDQGDHRAVQYGLWSLQLADPLHGKPALLLDDDARHGPLALTAQHNVLLYSTNQGIVPIPADGSVPRDIAALNYANNLYLSTVGTTSLTSETAHVLLTEQHDLPNSAAYHWITTPQFSKDGRTLLYIEFSSDAQVPFNRHSVIYIVHINGSGVHLSVDKPQLLATSTARFIELGTWLNDHVLILYADGALHALDSRSGAVETLVQTKSYARAIAVVRQDEP